MEKDSLIGPLGLDPYPTCKSCLFGKMTKSPFIGHHKRAAQILDLVHTDVCGPINEMACGGFHYFIIFTDDHSRYSYIYLMKNKSEPFNKLRKYKAVVENQTSYHIKTRRSDHGGEYMNT